LLKGIPAGLALSLLSVPYGATTNFVAVYAIEIGITAQTGFFFTFMAVGMGVSRIVARRIVDRGYVTQSIHFGFYPVIAAFVFLASCSQLIHWNLLLSNILFYSVAIFLGIGFGIIFPAYNMLFIYLASNNQRATARSTYLTSWNLGIDAGIILSGLIAEVSGFEMVYFIGAIVCVVSMLYFNYKVTPHSNQNIVR